MDKSFVERTMSELRMGEVDEEGKYRGRSIEEERMIEWMEDSNREGTLPGRGWLTRGKVQWRKRGDFR